MHVQSTPLGLQKVWDVNTYKHSQWSLLPSQQLNLEEHAISDTHLLGLWRLYRLTGSELWVTEN
jgi:hypothetical protein